MKYLLKFSLSAMLIFSLISCKTPSLVFSGNLSENTSVMAVKGRQGMQFNQVIIFGDYASTKIVRGWSQIETLDFFVKFKKAENKLSFTQKTPFGKSAEVSAVGHFKSTELPLFNDFLDYYLKYENTFVGTIKINEHTYWDFVVHNPEASLPKDADCGMIVSKNGNEIKIRGVKKFVGQQSWSQLDNHGFEFIQSGKTIGAVSVINDGKVWIKNEIADEIKTVLACVSTSLMVRESLEE